jgi:hypothetical protein
MVFERTAEELDYLGDMRAAALAQAIRMNGEYIRRFL